MNSKQILVLHTAIFVAFILGSLSSPLWAAYYPNFFESIFYLPSVVLLMMLTMASWRIFGGCPFTIWENNQRVKEGKLAYVGSCLPRYAQDWFGLSVSSKFATYFLVLCLLVPIGVGVVVRFTHL
jgi:hypothetical protein